MNILFVCQRLITFIINEIVEIQKLNNDVTIYSYHKSKSIYHKIVFPMLREQNLEKKIHINFNLPKTRFGKFFLVLWMLAKDITRYPLRTTKSILLLQKIFNKNGDRISCYIETRPIIEKRYDIIHSPFSTTGNIKRVYYLSQLMNTPFTLSFRAHDIYDDFEKSIEYKEYILKAANIFLTSSYYKPFIESRLDYPNKIQIIHGGVDVDFFSPNETKKRKNSIVSICRFDEVKGIIYLLKALRLLQDKSFFFSFYLIGEGPQEKEYRDYIKRKNIKNIFITDFLSREGVRNELAKSELFVLPCIELSNGSGDILANSIKEAMAMEIPVITSDIRGIRELVEDRKSGILVSQKNPAELAESIEFLFNNKALMRSMGKNGREKILLDFNITKECQKINKVFLSSINSNPK